MVFFPFWRGRTESAVKKRHRRKGRESFGKSNPAVMVVVVAGRKEGSEELAGGRRGRLREREGETRKLNPTQPSTVRLPHLQHHDNPTIPLLLSTLDLRSASFDFAPSLCSSLWLSRHQSPLPSASTFGIIRSTSTYRQQCPPRRTGQI